MSEMKDKFYESPSFKPIAAEIVQDDIDMSSISRLIPVFLYGIPCKNVVCMGGLLVALEVRQNSAASLPCHFKYTGKIGSVTGMVP
jgi:hypothetical protein